MHIRSATEADLIGILEIENREIATNSAHFGQVPLTFEECLSSFRSAEGKYPWLVAIEDDEVVAFARCGPWKARESYRFTTEVGVYVRPEFQRRGIAKQLYAELFPAIRKNGFKTVLAGIAQPNEASNRLHELLGMQYVGTLPDVGFKFGKWISVAYWAVHWE